MSPTRTSQWGAGDHPLAHGSDGKQWEAAHQALKEAPTLWQRLQFRGVQHVGGPTLLELRGCPECDSTVYREIDLGEALASLRQLGSVYARSVELILGYVGKDLPSFTVRAHDSAETILATRVSFKCAVRIYDDRGGSATVFDDKTGQLACMADVAMSCPCPKCCRQGGGDHGQG